ncbi:MAG: thioredoxin domain-containing protein [Candidatus Komeilibacteria bacterium]|nr:thioredoxin domain-containing protein [Candidatus Komeilibacteria bacterium]
MSDLNPKQVNRLVYLALGLLLVFTILIVTRYYYGAKVLKDDQEYLESLNNVSQQVTQPLLTAPVLRATDPALGQTTAKNQLVIYSDFQCPHCADAEQVLGQLLQNHPADVLLIWKDYPNPDYQQSQRAAIAARCAQVQNKFWEFHDYLYANQDQLGSNLYTQVASALKLDLAKFSQCYDNQQTLPLIMEDFQEGQGLRLDGTPYLFVNNQRFNQEITLEQLEKALK